MRAEVVRRDAPDDDDGRGIWRRPCTGCGQRNPGHPGSRCPGRLEIVSDPPQYLGPLPGDAWQGAGLAARGAPLTVGDLRSARAAPTAHRVVPAYAADLLADGASLTFTDGGALVVSPSVVGRWERVVARLRVFARRQEPRRAGYFYALDTGVGRALGWAERTGWSYRCWRVCRLFAAAVRAVLGALIGHPRGAAGAAAFAALYASFPAWRRLHPRGLGTLRSPSGIAERGTCSSAGGVRPGRGPPGRGTGTANTGQEESRQPQRGATRSGGAAQQGARR